jgi:hypothetical protein
MAELNIIGLIQRFYGFVGIFLFCYDVDNVNNLRLWQATSSDEFDLEILLWGYVSGGEENHFREHQQSALSQ